MAAAFIVSRTAGVIAMVFLILYQQFENSVLQVMIMSRRARANPLVVLLSVLLGVDLFGMVGALLAIPVAGAMSVILSWVWRHRPLRGTTNCSSSPTAGHMSRPRRKHGCAGSSSSPVGCHSISREVPTAPRGGDQHVARALPGAADAALGPPRPPRHHAAGGNATSPKVAPLQDAAQFVLARSWVATVVAAAFGYFWITAIGLCLGVYHLVLLRRSARPDEVPAWVESAPTLGLAVANVYLDTVEFAASGRQLAELDVDVDVVIVVEKTPRFREAFDAAAGSDGLRTEHSTPPTGRITLSRSTSGWSQNRSA